MSEEREPFLERWSRLKQEQPAEKAEPAVALQPIEELKPDSDFTPFMNPKVDAATRSAALKKLFADPRYNVPDAFESYSGDWTGGEPIPLEMLKQLNHAKKLLFDEVEKTAQAPSSKSAQAPIEKPERQQPELKDAVGKQNV
jgi:hypothetical protein